METIKAILNFTFFEVSNYSFHLYNLLYLIITIALVMFVNKFFRIFIKKTIKTRDWIDGEKAEVINRIGRLFILVLGIILGVRALELGNIVNRILKYPLSSGEHPILIKSILVGIFALLVSVMLIRLTIILLRVSIRSHSSIDRGREFSILRLYKYFAYVVAVIFAMHLTGINLGGLLIGSAALLVGIGFAIQNLFNDFFSGLILLFEDSFDIGDIIFMDGEIMRVKKIDLRTSTMQKPDGNYVTIPNRLLTDNKIDNWTQESLFARYEIKLQVAYGSDLDKVKSVLYKTAVSQPEVSKDHPIKIFFDDFADSGLQITLLYWMKTTWDYREILSNTRFNIDKQFRENDITIPFPQRDIHIRQSVEFPDQKI